MFEPNGKWLRVVFELKWCNTQWLVSTKHRKELSSVVPYYWSQGWMDSDVYHPLWYTKVKIIDYIICVIPLKWIVHTTPSMYMDFGRPFKSIVWFTHACWASKNNQKIFWVVVIVTPILILWISWHPKMFSLLFSGLETLQTINQKVMVKTSNSRQFIIDVNWFEIKYIQQTIRNPIPY